MNENLHPLSPKQLEELIERLENLDEETEESYEYPVSDLVANLHHPGISRRSKAEIIDGKLTRYFLYFTSPPETWERLCGRSGTYTVDADSLKALCFDCSLMS